MAFDIDDMNEDLLTMINDLSTIFSFDGGDYTGTKTLLKKEILFTDFGFQDDYEFSLIARYSSVGTVPPVTGDIITINSIEYRVLTSKITSGDVEIRFDLGKKYTNG